jgi:hypothetical protein
MKPGPAQNPAPALNVEIEGLEVLDQLTGSRLRVNTVLYPSVLRRLFKVDSTERFARGGGAMPFPTRREFGADNRSSLAAQMFSNWMWAMPLRPSTRTAVDADNEHEAEDSRSYVMTANGGGYQGKDGPLNTVHHFLELNLGLFALRVTFAELLELFYEGSYERFVRGGDEGTEDRKDSSLAYTRGTTVHTPQLMRRNDRAETFPEEAAAVTHTFYVVLNVSAPALRTGVPGSADWSPEQAAEYRLPHKFTELLLRVGAITDPAEKRALVANEHPLVPLADNAHLVYAVSRSAAKTADALADHLRAGKHAFGVASLCVANFPDRPLGAAAAAAAAVPVRSATGLVPTAAQAAAVAEAVAAFAVDEDEGTDVVPSPPRAATATPVAGLPMDAVPVPLKNESLGNFTDSGEDEPPTPTAHDKKRAKTAARPAKRR